MMHTVTDPIYINVPRNPRGQPNAMLRALYREHVADPRRQTTRQGLWIAVLVYLLFSISDILLIPDVARYTVATRFIISAIMLAGMEWQVRRGGRADAIDATAAIALILAYGGWVSSALLTAQTEIMSYYMVFGAIFMMSIGLFFNFPFRLSLMASAVIVLLFFAALLSFPQEEQVYKLTFGIFCLSCFIFTSYVNWKLNHERYHVFLNALAAKARQEEAAERGEELLRLSNTDPLTGLANRRAIDATLRQYWRQWREAGTPFAVILIDVDFFKRYNDYHGHLDGDRCLVRVAGALRDLSTRHGAALGRYGGEEFIVVVGLDRDEDVAAFAEVIRGAVEDLSLRHEQRRDGTATVTVSVGAALTRDDSAVRVEKVIHQADRALYSAKAAGRNCVKLFDPDDPNNSDDSENIAALLKIAIAQDLVSMVYQPVLDLSGGETAAVEALMRLRMLDGTPISPSTFIPVAERTGAIIELGQWAIRRVCEDILVKDPAPVVSVNVSPLQLQMPGFAAWVALTLSEFGICGDRLAFEITEGQEMEIHSSLLRCITDLKALGIKIWLDDFGTGFAGLSWLRLIDFDCVKIDKSFLHGFTTSKGSVMLADIVRLARNIGARILVEGIETEEHLALMRRLQVDLGQGYYLGRPAPVSTMRAKVSGRAAAVG
ncbi:MAG: GGDEF domain-containing protein [Alphaproteobacteria bacterium]|nr:GGDEF domain-containing protein [Alphaproteobacteria bacterium]MBU1552990.1 GGDEF domain-containing protein [Alphaproteobacteria bacterium]MBU2338250.1 GGDEF domain-containing protein [Alphaproteobacteria bacterium]MBU2388229.1 GGDEF domain-containing protein [Alphaproteobacteria bacterium]